MSLSPKLTFAAAPLALAAVIRSAESDAIAIARASGLIIGSGAAAS